MRRQAEARDAIQAAGDSANPLYRPPPEAKKPIEHKSNDWGISCDGAGGDDVPEAQAIAGSGVQFAYLRAEEKTPVVQSEDFVATGEDDLETLRKKLQGLK